MAKKKKQKKGGQQQFLSPEKFLKTRARFLKIGKCYCAVNLFEIGVGYVLVSREHTGGKISYACYLIETFYLGLKDSMYAIRVDADDFIDTVEMLSETTELEECSYEEAHNIIYGAIEYAAEQGRKPHSSFMITKYMLEEDTDDIPLIEYEFGNSFRHNLPPAESDEDDESIIKSDNETNPTCDMETENDNKSQQLAENLNLHNKWLVEELSKPENAYWLEKPLISKILALPKEELRSDLEEIIRYVITITKDGDIPSYFEHGDINGILSSSLILLGEVGNNSSSLDLVLESLRQSEDFYDYHYGDTAHHVIVPTLYKIMTADDFDKLLSFMKEPLPYSFGKSHVAETILQIVFNQPELRQTCIEWFDKVITFATEKLPEEEYFDGALAGIITSDVIDIQASELLPKIEAMYDTGYVNEMWCGSFDDVKKKISKKKKQSHEEFFSTDVYKIFAHQKSYLKGHI